MSGKRISAELRSRMEARQKELFERYVNQVQSGVRKAGLSERLKVDRHVADLERTDWEWTFSWKVAHKTLVWMQANLRFPSGLCQGKALILEGWQVFDIATLFGWVSKDDPRQRRFTTGYWQVARKNGKSTIGGGVADYLAFGDDYPDARVYIAASSMEQCQESFSSASNMLILGWYQGKVVVSDTKNNKQIDLIKTKAFVKGISANPKDGKLPHGLLLDEYHQHPDKKLYNSIDSGRVADPTAMMLIITTAGTELGGVCHQEYEKCKQILMGAEESDRYWISIYEPDEGDRDDDPVSWEKANPNMGVSVNTGMLQDRYDKCKLTESDLVDFRIKNMDKWVMGSTRWANMDIWLERCCDPFDAEELVGRTCYGGLDLSSTSDFTAFVLTFPPRSEGEKWKQLYMYWIPGDNVVALSRQLRKPLQDWIAKGLMRAPLGPVVDYLDVGNFIRNCMETYDLRLIACDAWKLELFAAKVGDWFESIAAKFSQGMKNMFLPVDQYKEAYLTGTISCGGNPVQTWMMDCVESSTDTNGNAKLVKPKLERSKTRIDGVIASIMSYNTAVDNEGQGNLDAKEDFIFF